MAQVEQELWWYQALHSLVLNSIRKYFPDPDISIIDAGCGTGGLLLFLQARGYTDIQGFDLSKDAVRFCRQRKLSVDRDRLQNIATRYALASTNVIISNDTLYFLTEQERAAFVLHCFQLLKPDGLLLLNLPALKAFRGIHDLSVGIQHRFSKSDIPTLFMQCDFHLVQQIYWPLFLSPLIYLTRLRQRITMRFATHFDVRSDIDIPKPFLNMCLLGITHCENRWLRSKPWGSSLFVVAQKRHAHTA
jgi:SAM-dependent methyltransferase